MDREQLAEQFAALIRNARSEGHDDTFIAKSISQAFGDDFDLVESVVSTSLNSRGFLWGFLSPAHHFPWESHIGSGDGWEDIEGPITVVYSYDGDGEKEEFGDWKSAARVVGQHIGERISGELSETLHFHAPHLSRLDDDEPWVVNITEVDVI